YLTATETAMGAMLAQYLQESRKENAIYYLSKKMTDYEANYDPLEKTCVALVWATQKLRHYMLSFRVLLISRMDPLKYLLEKPALSYRTARWLLLLSEFDIQYVVQKSTKGRAIADQLAECPSSPVGPINHQFPDEEIMEIEKKPWKVYFDGAANKRGFGIGVLLISPDDVFTPLAAKLSFEATNNITEYEACILALEAALELGIEELEVYGDSALIICQIKGQWK
ncbi:reverse transcriptase-like protein, partial [Modestobacter lapidis]|nr:reverse transcriptase-like protein [Modestobacter lapidis]